ncbi:MAG: hypothetical protein O8C68_09290 [Candidatus Methanoperedens sp.]|nr:hypothetical protein [Candidatus Methanoperedens sp.]
MFTELSYDADIIIEIKDIGSVYYMWNKEQGSLAILFLSISKELKIKPAILIYYFTRRFSHCSRRKNAL